MAENPESLIRPSVKDLEEILGVPFQVLDDGFIRVIDYMGSDEAIVQAARVSYGKGTKRVSEDRGLIRYLMRNWHTTPFEHVRDQVSCSCANGLLASMDSASHSERK
jgi:thymidylate synthase (FAD)